MDYHDNHRSVAHYPDITADRVYRQQEVEERDRCAWNVPEYAEYAMEMLDKMAEGILGGNARRFVNYIGTIFLFILFCNLSGLFGLRAPTGDFGVTFLLGMFTFFIVNYQGIKNRGVGHFTSLFQPIPILFPINVIGEIANPISISLRLFANLLSGIIIMGLWYGMMPWSPRLVFRRHYMCTVIYSQDAFRRMYSVC